MAKCPFYQIHMHRPAGEPQSALEPVPWCSHTHSPVPIRAATDAAGGAPKLQCGGDLERCAIPLDLRPRS